MHHRWTCSSMANPVYTGPAQLAWHVLFHHSIMMNWSSALRWWYNGHHKIRAHVTYVCDRISSNSWCYPVVHTSTRPMDLVRGWDRHSYAVFRFSMFTDGCSALLAVAIDTWSLDKQQMEGWKPLSRETNVSFVRRFGSLFPVPP